MALVKAKVLTVKHYTDNLFHFTVEREPSLKFRDGEFVMMGINTDENDYGFPAEGNILRAYSIASPNHQETLEFYSIKVEDGPLTSRLQHIKPGDEVLVNTKAVGTLVLDNLKPGRNLYLLATGTGVAPFLSLVRGLETYDNYDRVVLVWGARSVAELPFDAFFRNINKHEVYGELTQDKFLFYPTVTRQMYENEGRVTTAMFEGKVQEKLNLDPIDPEHDRVMICGSIEFNADLVEWLEANGFKEGNNSEAGTYVVERAFVG